MQKGTGSNRGCPSRLGSEWLHYAAGPTFRQSHRNSHPRAGTNQSGRRGQNDEPRTTNSNGHAH